jgi:glycosyltransferase involved in cell wall biosynthesis
MIICSTIIPTINRSTLERSVRSALEQDFDSESHEILVFNNSDEPLPKTKWLSSPQVRVVNSHSNVNDASNDGAKMASGKYINFLHDDDYLLPGALKALVEIAEATGNYWVCGGYNLIDDDGNFVSEVRPQIEGNIFALLVGGECLHLAASLVNREAFLQVGGFDLQVFGLSDIDLESQLALLSDFESIDQIVATVRVAGGKGKTHDWTSRTQQDFRRMREKALNSNGALARMMDSVRGDVLLRGRACRSYLFSAILNLKSFNFGAASRRLVSLLPLTSYHFILPDFWRGLFFRSHWHNVQKSEQEQYFKTHYPSEESGFWRT